MPSTFCLTKYRVKKILETSLKKSDKNTFPGIRKQFERYVSQRDFGEMPKGRITNAVAFSRMQSHLPTNEFYENTPCLLGYANVAVCYDQGGEVVIRHLTPDEYCILQGFPEGWDDGLGASKQTRYYLWGLGVALPCIDFIFKGILKNEETSTF